MDNYINNSKREMAELIQQIEKEKPAILDFIRFPRPDENDNSLFAQSKRQIFGNRRTSYDQIRQRGPKMHSVYEDLLTQKNTELPKHKDRSFAPEFNGRQPGGRKTRKTRSRR